jgi:hypothetical protein
VVGNGRLVRASSDSCRHSSCTPCSSGEAIATGPHPLLVALMIVILSVFAAGTAMIFPVLRCSSATRQASFPTSPESGSSLSPVLSIWMHKGQLIQQGKPDDIMERHTRSSSR